MFETKKKRERERGKNKERNDGFCEKADRNPIISAVDGQKAGNYNRRVIPSALLWK